MFSSHLNSTALIRTSNLIPATGQRAGARWRAPGALRPGYTTLGTYVLESYKYCVHERDRELTANAEAYQPTREPQHRGGNSVHSGNNQ